MHSRAGLCSLPTALGLAVFHVIGNAWPMRRDIALAACPGDANLGAREGMIFVITSAARFFAPRRWTLAASPRLGDLRRHPRLGCTRRFGRPPTADEFDGLLDHPPGASRTSDTDDELIRIAHIKTWILCARRRPHPRALALGGHLGVAWAAALDGVALAAGGLLSNMRRSRSDFHSACRCLPGTSRDLAPISLLSGTSVGNGIFRETQFNATLISSTAADTAVVLQGDFCAPDKLMCFQLRE